MRAKNDELGSGSPGGKSALRNWGLCEGYGSAICNGDVSASPLLVGPKTSHPSLGVRGQLADRPDTVLNNVDDIPVERAADFA